jgi:hypothetical protein
VGGRGDEVLAEFVAERRIAQGELYTLASKLRYPPDVYRIRAGDNSGNIILGSGPNGFECVLRNRGGSIDAAIGAAVPEQLGRRYAPEYPCFGSLGMRQQSGEPRQRYLD